MPWRREIKSMAGPLPSPSFSAFRLEDVHCANRTGPRVADQVETAAVRGDPLRKVEATRSELGDGDRRTETIGNRRSVRAVDLGCIATRPGKVARELIGRHD